MADIKYYIEALGLAENENGSPAHGSMAIKVGSFAPGKYVPYDELTKDLCPVDVIKMFLPGYASSLSEVRFITPEEYEREYGGGDE